ncbi:hypothetical protein SELMODRAFT_87327 [Selaginella moellendorffii]|uniref:Uncharacterized protein n=1 Tax=Selaginella moellendorffii TaxID=88036 RepID=D8R8C2_SELML|nr:hypothetical protein SELMODRAFT_87327 [Selaginella moellendorffii]
MGSCIGLCCYLSVHYKTKLQKKYKLPRSQSQDFISHCFYECYSLAQEFQQQKAKSIKSTMVDQS